MKEEEVTTDKDSNKNHLEMNQATSIFFRHTPLELRNNQKNKLFSTKSLDPHIFKHGKNEEVELVNKINGIISKHVNEEMNYDERHSIKEDNKETSIWFCCDDLTRDTEHEDDTIPSSNLLDDSVSSSVNANNANYLVIKKPIRKASSWNILQSCSNPIQIKNCAASVGNSSASQKSLDTTTEKELNSQDALSGKFSLFPTSTDTDPMSSIRKNLSTTTSNHFDMSNSTKAIFSSTSIGVKLLNEDKSPRAQNDKMVQQTLDKNSPDSGITFDGSSKSINCKKNKSSYFEKTFQNLSLDVTILPSI